MKIERPKSDNFLLSVATQPETQRVVIETITGCQSSTELLRALEGFCFWPWDRGDVLCWSPVLNLFDDFLLVYVAENKLGGPSCKESIRGAGESPLWGTVSDRLVERILHVTFLILESCSSRAVYQSAELLVALLDSFNPSIVFGSLQCLCLFHSCFRSKTRRQAELRFSADLRLRLPFLCSNPSQDLASDCSDRPAFLKPLCDDINVLLLGSSRNEERESHQLSEDNPTFYVQNNNNTRQHLFSQNASEMSAPSMLDTGEGVVLSDVWENYSAATLRPEEAGELGDILSYYLGKVPVDEDILKRQTLTLHVPVDNSVQSSFPNARTISSENIHAQSTAGVASSSTTKVVQISSIEILNNFTPEQIAALDMVQLTLQQTRVFQEIALKYDLLQDNCFFEEDTAYYGMLEELRKRIRLLWCSCHPEGRRRLVDIRITALGVIVCMNSQFFLNYLSTCPSLLPDLTAVLRNHELVHKRTLCCTLDLWTGVVQEKIQNRTVIHLLGLASPHGLFPSLLLKFLGNSSELDLPVPVLLHCGSNTETASASSTILDTVGQATQEPLLEPPVLPSDSSVRDNLQITITEDPDIFRRSWGLPYYPVAVDSSGHWTPRLCDSSMHVQEAPGRCILYQDHDLVGPELVSTSESLRLRCRVLENLMELFLAVLSTSPSFGALSHTAVLQKLVEFFHVLDPTYVPATIGICRIFEGLMDFSSSVLPILHGSLDAISCLALRLQYEIGRLAQLPVLEGDTIRSVTFFTNKQKGPNEHVKDYLRDLASPKAQEALQLIEEVSHRRCLARVIFKELSSYLHPPDTSVTQVPQLPDIFSGPCGLACRLIFQKPLHYGLSVYAAAVNAVTDFVSEDPAAQPTLIRRKIVPDFLMSITEEVFQLEETLQAIPSGIAAILLHNSGDHEMQLLNYKPIHTTISVVSREDFVGFDRVGEVMALMGSRLAEGGRNQRNASTHVAEATLNMVCQMAEDSQLLPRWCPVPTDEALSAVDAYLSSAPATLKDLQLPPIPPSRYLADRLSNMARFLQANLTTPGTLWSFVRDDGPKFVLKCLASPALPPLFLRVLPHHPINGVLRILSTFSETSQTVSQCPAFVRTYIESLSKSVQDLSLLNEISPWLTVSSQKDNTDRAVQINDHPTLGVLHTNKLLLRTSDNSYSEHDIAPSSSNSLLLKDEQQLYCSVAECSSADLVYARIMKALSELDMAVYLLMASNKDSTLNPISVSSAWRTDQHAPFIQLLSKALNHLHSGLPILLRFLYRQSVVRSSETPVVLSTRHAAHEHPGVRASKKYLSPDVQAVQATNFFWTSLAKYAYSVENPLFNEAGPLPYSKVTVTVANSPHFRERDCPIITKTLLFEAVRAVCVHSRLLLATASKFINVVSTRRSRAYTNPRIAPEQQATAIYLAVAAQELLAAVPAIPLPCLPPEEVQHLAGGMCGYAEERFIEEFADQRGDLNFVMRPCENVETIRSAALCIPGLTPLQTARYIAEVMDILYRLHVDDKNHGSLFTLTVDTFYKFGGLNLILKGFHYTFGLLVAATAALVVKDTPGATVSSVIMGMPEFLSIKQPRFAQWLEAATLQWMGSSSNDLGLECNVVSKCLHCCVSFCEKITSWKRLYNSPMSAFLQKVCGAPLKPSSPMPINNTQQPAAVASLDERSLLSREPLSSMVDDGEDNNSADHSGPCRPGPIRNGDLEHTSVADDGIRPLALSTDSVSLLHQTRDIGVPQEPPSTARLPLCGSSFGSDGEFDAATLLRSIQGHVTRHMLVWNLSFMRSLKSLEKAGPMFHKLSHILFSHFPAKAVNCLVKVYFHFLDAESPPRKLHTASWKVQHSSTLAEIEERPVRPVDAYMQETIARLVELQVSSGLVTGGLDWIFGSGEGQQQQSNSVVDPHAPLAIGDNRRQTESGIPGYNTVDHATISSFSTPSEHQQHQQSDDIDMDDGRLHHEMSQNDQQSTTCRTTHVDIGVQTEASKVIPLSRLAALERAGRVIDWKTSDTIVLLDLVQGMVFNFILDLGWRVLNYPTVITEAAIKLVAVPVSICKTPEISKFDDTDQNRHYYGGIEPMLRHQLNNSTGKAENDISHNCEQLGGSNVTSLQPGQLKHPTVSLPSAPTTTDIKQVTDDNSWYCTLQLIEYLDTLYKCIEILPSEHKASFFETPPFLLSQNDASTTGGTAALQQNVAGAASHDPSDIRITLGISDMSPPTRLQDILQESGPLTSSEQPSPTNNSLQVAAPPSTRLSPLESTRHSPRGKATDASSLFNGSRQGQDECLTRWIHETLHCYFYILINLLHRSPISRQAMIQRVGSAPAFFLKFAKLFPEFRKDAASTPKRKTLIVDPYVPNLDLNLSKTFSQKDYNETFGQSNKEAKSIPLTGNYHEQAYDLRIFPWCLKPCTPWLLKNAAVVQTVQTTITNSLRKTPGIAPGEFPLAVLDKPPDIPFNARLPDWITCCFLGLSEMLRLYELDHDLDNQTATINADVDCILAMDSPNKRFIVVEDQKALIRLCIDVLYYFPGVEGFLATAIVQLLIPLTTIVSNAQYFLEYNPDPIRPMLHGGGLGLLLKLPRTAHFSGMLRLISAIVCNLCESPASAEWRLLADITRIFEVSGENRSFLEKVTSEEKKTLLAKESNSKHNGDDVVTLSEQGDSQDYFPVERRVLGLNTLLSGLYAYLRKDPALFKKVISENCVFLCKSKLQKLSSTTEAHLNQPMQGINATEQHSAIETPLTAPGQPDATKLPSSPLVEQSSDVSSHSALADSISKTHFSDTCGAAVDTTQPSFLLALKPREPCEPEEIAQQAKNINASASHVIPILLDYLNLFISIHAHTRLTPSFSDFLTNTAEPPKPFTGRNIKDVPIYPYAILPDSILFLLDDLLASNPQFATVLLDTPPKACPEQSLFNSSKQASAKDSAIFPSDCIQPFNFLMWPPFPSVPTNFANIDDNTTQLPRASPTEDTDAAHIEASESQVHTNAVVLPLFLYLNKWDVTSSQNRPERETLIRWVFRYIFTKSVVLCSPNCVATTEWKEGERASPFLSHSNSSDAAELNALSAAAMVGGPRPPFDTLMHLTTRLLRTVSSANSVLQQVVVRELFKVLTELEWRGPPSISEECKMFRDAFNNSIIVPPNTFSFYCLTTLKPLPRDVFNIAIFGASSSLCSVLHLIRDPTVSNRSWLPLLPSDVLDDDKIANVPGSASSMKFSPVDEKCKVLQNQSSSQLPAHKHATIITPDTIVQLRNTMSHLLALVDLNAMDAQPVCRSLVRCLDCLARDVIFIMFSLGVTESALLTYISQRDRSRYTKRSGTRASITAGELQRQQQDHQQQKHVLHQSSLNGESGGATLLRDNTSATLFDSQTLRCDMIDDGGNAAEAPSSTDAADDSVVNASRRRPVSMVHDLVEPAVLAAAVAAANRTDYHHHRIDDVEVIGGSGDFENVADNDDEDEDDEDQEDEEDETTDEEDDITMGEDENLDCPPTLPHEADDMEENTGHFGLAARSSESESDEEAFDEEDDVPRIRDDDEDADVILSILPQELGAAGVTELIDEEEDDGTGPRNHSLRLLIGDDEDGGTPGLLRDGDEMRHCCSHHPLGDRDQDEDDVEEGDDVSDLEMAGDEYDAVSEDDQDEEADDDDEEDDNIEERRNGILQTAVMSALPSEQQRGLEALTSHDNRLDFLPSSGVPQSAAAASFNGTNSFNPSQAVPQQLGSSISISADVLGSQENILGFHRASGTTFQAPASVVPQVGTYSELAVDFEGDDDDEEEGEEEEDDGEEAEDEVEEDEALRFTGLNGHRASSNVQVNLGFDFFPSSSNAGVASFYVSVPEGSAGVSSTSGSRVQTYGGNSGLQDTSTIPGTRSDPPGGWTVPGDLALPPYHPILSFSRSSRAIDAPSTATSGRTAPTQRVLLQSHGPSNSSSRVLRSRWDAFRHEVGTGTAPMVSPMSAGRVAASESVPQLASAMSPFQLLFDPWSQMALSSSAAPSTQNLFSTSVGTSSVTRSSPPPASATSDLSERAAVDMVMDNFRQWLRTSSVNRREYVPTPASPHGAVASSRPASVADIQHNEENSLVNSEVLDQAAPHESESMPGPNSVEACSFTLPQSQSESSSVDHGSGAAHFTEPDLPERSITYIPASGDAPAIDHLVVEENTQTGADTLRSRAGANTATDGAGVDIATDGAGADTATDGVGADSATDGAGADSAADGAGGDIVTDQAGAEGATLETDTIGDEAIHQPIPLQQPQQERQDRLEAVTGTLADYYAIVRHEELTHSLGFSSAPIRNLSIALGLTQRQVLTAMGIDPSFLEALPEDIQLEILTQQAPSMTTNQVLGFRVENLRSIESARQTVDTNPVTMPDISGVVYLPDILPATGTGLIEPRGIAEPTNNSTIENIAARNDGSASDIREAYAGTITRQAEEPLASALSTTMVNDILIDGSDATMPERLETTSAASDSRAALVQHTSSDGGLAVSHSMTSSPILLQNPISNGFQASSTTHIGIGLPLSRLQPLTPLSMPTAMRDVGQIDCSSVVDIEHNNDSVETVDQHDGIPAIRLPIQPEGEATVHGEQPSPTSSRLIDPSSIRIPPSILGALPIDIRGMVTSVLSGPSRDTAASELPGGVVLDNATFLATLDPALRQELLLTATDDVLRALPPECVAEAVILRDRARTRPTHIPSGGLRHFRRSQQPHERTGEGRGRSVRSVLGANTVNDSFDQIYNALFNAMQLPVPRIARQSALSAQNQIHHHSRNMLQELGFTLRPPRSVANASDSLEGIFNDIDISVVQINQGATGREATVELTTLPAARLLHHMRRPAGVGGINAISVIHDQGISRDPFSDGAFTAVLRSDRGNTSAASNEAATAAAARISTEFLQHLSSNYRGLSAFLNTPISKMAVLSVCRLLYLKRQIYRRDMHRLLFSLATFHPLTRRYLLELLMVTIWASAQDMPAVTGFPTSSPQLQALGFPPWRLYSALPLSVSMLFDSDQPAAASIAGYRALEHTRSLLEVVPQAAEFFGTLNDHPSFIEVNHSHHHFSALWHEHQQQQHHTASSSSCHQQPSITVNRGDALQQIPTLNDSIVVTPAEGINNSDPHHQILMSNNESRRKKKKRDSNIAVWTTTSSDPHSLEPTVLHSMSSLSNNRSTAAPQYPEAHANEAEVNKTNSTNTDGKRQTSPSLQVQQRSSSETETGFGTNRNGANCILEYPINILIILTGASLFQSSSNHMLHLLSAIHFLLYGASSIALTPNNVPQNSNLAARSGSTAPATTMRENEQTHGNRTDCFDGSNVVCSEHSDHATLSAPLEMLQPTPLAADQQLSEHYDTQPSSVPPPTVRIISGNSGLLPSDDTVAGSSGIERGQLEGPVAFLYTTDPTSTLTTPAPSPVQVSSSQQDNETQRSNRMQVPSQLQRNPADDTTTGRAQHLRENVQAGSVPSSTVPAPHDSISASYSPPSNATLVSSKILSAVSMKAVTVICRVFAGIPPEELALQPTSATQSKKSWSLSKSMLAHLAQLPLLARIIARLYRSPKHQDIVYNSIATSTSALIKFVIHCLTKLREHIAQTTALSRKVVISSTIAPSSQANRSAICHNEVPLDFLPPENMREKLDACLNLLLRLCLSFQEVFLGPELTTATTTTTTANPNNLAEHETNGSSHESNPQNNSVLNNQTNVTQLQNENEEQARTSTTLETIETRVNETAAETELATASITDCRQRSTLESRLSVPSAVPLDISKRQKLSSQMQGDETLKTLARFFETVNVSSLWSVLDGLLREIETVCPTLSGKPAALNSIQEQSDNNNMISAFEQQQQQLILTPSSSSLPQTPVDQQQNGPLSPPLVVNQLLPLIDCYLFAQQIAISADLNLGAAEVPRVLSLTSLGSKPDPHLQQQFSEKIATILLNPEEKLTKHYAELLNFCERHRKILNLLIRQCPGSLNGAFQPLVALAPMCISFENKRHFFRQRLKQLREGSRFDSIRLNVRRNQVFMDSFHQLRMRTGEEMKGKLVVQFQGEEGVDAGGLSREWFAILAREMFNPDYALFKREGAKSEFNHPNPLSHVNPDHLCFFKFIGRVIGKAVYDGQHLGAYFTRSFYKHMLGHKVTPADAESTDPEVYKGLQMLLSHNIDDLGLDLRFSTDIDEFGRTQVVDLIPDGRNIPVTEENKHEYVRLVCEHKITQGIRPQIDAFLGGFHELIPPKFLTIFDDKELELLISGLSYVDVNNLRANTEYHNYDSKSPQIVWFWEVLEEMDQNRLTTFLQFVTGTSRVPLGGFKELMGMRGPQLFSIHRDYGERRLPSAHTCFNQLDLPEYSSKEQLKYVGEGDKTAHLFCDFRSKLLTAISEGKEGFGFV